jgi:hypothetical protein
VVYLFQIDRAFKQKEQESSGFRLLVSVFLVFCVLLPSKDSIIDRLLDFWQFLIFNIESLIDVKQNPLWFLVSRLRIGDFPS